MSVAPCSARFRADEGTRMLQDFVVAALAMQRAVELDGEEPQWRSERDRLLLCVPEQTSALLQVRALFYGVKVVSCN